MVIYRRYVELVNKNGRVKKVVLLWDDYDEAINYFVGLKEYSRCRLVEVWKMEPTIDHVFKDTECIASWS